MKRIIYTSLLILLMISTNAQSQVSWSFETKKFGDTTIVVHIIASIKNGWHLYSQTQPNDAIAVPTKIQFNKNSLVTLTGKIKEIGKLEKYTEPTLGIEQWQYADKVEFVQLVQSKKNVKTNVNGAIEYQVCTNEKCLPPKTIQFSVKLE